MLSTNKVDFRLFLSHFFPFYSPPPSLTPPGGQLTDQVAPEDDKDEEEVIADKILRELAREYFDVGFFFFFFFFNI
mgnify:CR=1 FL=1